MKNLPSCRCYLCGFLGRNSLDILIKAAVTCACGALALAANPLIRLLLKKVDPPQPQTGPRLLEAEQVLRGGRWIGMLERTAAYATVVAGFPMGLAIIIAVKGLGRYPQLRAETDSRVGELFIIGTFASLLWAVAFAGIAYAGVRLW